MTITVFKNDPPFNKMSKNVRDDESKYFWVDWEKYSHHNFQWFFLAKRDICINDNFYKISIEYLQQKFQWVRIAECVLNLDAFYHITIKLYQEKSILVSKNHRISDLSIVNINLHQKNDCLTRNIDRVVFVFGFRFQCYEMMMSDITCDAHLIFNLQHYFLVLCFNIKVAIFNVSSFKMRYCVCGEFTVFIDELHIIMILGRTNNRDRLTISYDKTNKRQKDKATGQVVRIRLKEIQHKRSDMHRECPKSPFEMMRKIILLELNNNITGINAELIDLYYVIPIKINIKNPVFRLNLMFFIVKMRTNFCIPPKPLYPIVPSLIINMCVTNMTKSCTTWYFTNMDSSKCVFIPPPDINMYDMNMTKNRTTWHYINMDVFKRVFILPPDTKLICKSEHKPNDIICIRFTYTIRMFYNWSLVTGWVFEWKRINPYDKKMWITSPFDRFLHVNDDTEGNNHHIFVCVSEQPGLDGKRRKNLVGRVRCLVTYILCNTLQVFSKPVRHRCVVFDCKYLKNYSKKKDRTSTQEKLLINQIISFWSPKKATWLSCNISNVRKCEYLNTKNDKKYITSIPTHRSSGGFILCTCRYCISLYSHMTNENTDNISLHHVFFYFYRIINPIWILTIWKMFSESSYRFADICKYEYAKNNASSFSEYGTIIGKIAMMYVRGSILYWQEYENCKYIRSNRIRNICLCMMGSQKMSAKNWYHNGVIAKRFIENGLNSSSFLGHRVLRVHAYQCLELQQATGSMKIQMWCIISCVNNPQKISPMINNILENDSMCTVIVTKIIRVQKHCLGMITRRKKNTIDLARKINNESELMQLMVPQTLVKRVGGAPHTYLSKHISYVIYYTVVIFGKDPIECRIFSFEVNPPFLSCKGLMNARVTSNLKCRNLFMNIATNLMVMKFPNPQPKLTNQSIKSLRLDPRVLNLISLLNSRKQYGSMIPCKQYGCSRKMVLRLLSKTKNGHKNWHFTPNRTKKLEKFDINIQKNKILTISFRNSWYKHETKNIPRRVHESYQLIQHNISGPSIIDNSNAMSIGYKTIMGTSVNKSACRFCVTMKHATYSVLRERTSQGPSQEHELGIQRSRDTLSQNGYGLSIITKRTKIPPVCHIINSITIKNMYLNHKYQNLYPLCGNYTNLQKKSRKKITQKNIRKTTFKHHDMDHEIDMTQITDVPINVNNHMAKCVYFKNMVPSITSAMRCKFEPYEKSLKYTMRCEIFNLIKRNLKVYRYRMEIPNKPQKCNKTWIFTLNCITINIMTKKDLCRKYQKYEHVNRHRPSEAGVLYLINTGKVRMTEIGYDLLPHCTAKTHILIPYHEQSRIEIFYYDMKTVFSSDEIHENVRVVSEHNTAINVVKKMIRRDRCDKNDICIGSITLILNQSNVCKTLIKYVMYVLKMQPKNGLLKKYLSNKVFVCKSRTKNMKKDLKDKFSKQYLSAATVGHNHHNFVINIPSASTMSILWYIIRTMCGTNSRFIPMGFRHNRYV